MKILGPLIIGISAIVSAMLISGGLTDLRTGDRYVTVKGVAEREVNADPGPVADTVCSHRQYP